MDIQEFISTILSQFAGGPGPVENNLVRFGLAAIMWAILLVIAWQRQRTQDLPREKWLVWGFGLFLLREVYMFSQIAVQKMELFGPSEESVYHHPIEHMVFMAAIVVLASAFLRYVLDDLRVSRTYLIAGLVITAVCFTITLWTWPQFHAQYPELHFHQSWQAWIFHVPLAVLLLAAIALLARKRSWLSRTVNIALAFFFISEALILFNYATDNVHNTIICPIGNSFHLLAIPLLGFVYLREQSIEKQQAEDALKTYRDHLEELVEERTSELKAVNAQLQQEIHERELAENVVVQRNARLAALNTISATISKSLDLETVLNTALEMALEAIGMEIGALFLLDPDTGALSIRAHRGEVPVDQLSRTGEAKYSCIGISNQAVTSQQAVLQDLSHYPEIEKTVYIMSQGIRTIVSTPLVSKGVAVGALTLGSAEVDLVGQSELNLLTSIGQQVGVAVENARLFQDTERYADQLSTLHQVSLALASTLDPDMIKEEIARQSARLLNCEMAYVLCADQEQAACKIVSSHGMHQDLQHELIANSEGCQLLQPMVQDRRTLAIDDAYLDDRVPAYWVEVLGIRTVLCTPVWVNREPIEFLFLLDRRVIRHWKPEELKLIESFVNRAAVALENAYLHKQLEWAAALEERQRIAADMHDGLAQTLSLIGLNVDRAENMVRSGANGSVVDELKNIRHNVALATADVRRSIASLQDTPPPKRSLQDQLEEMVAQHLLGGELNVELTLSPQPEIFLPSDQSSQVLPIFQEALLNIRRHARAKNVNLSLEQYPDHLCLSLEDDGCGFDTHEPVQDSLGHFGLNIMRARAAQVGGILEIDSSPGEGTRLCLTWPRVVTRASWQSVGTLNLPVVQVEGTGEPRDA